MEVLHEKHRKTRRLRAGRGRQRGSVAVAAIVALAVCLTVSVGMLLAGEGARTSGHHEARVLAARAMAEAGLEYGYWQYAYQNAVLPFSQARVLAPGQFSVTVTDNSTAIQRSLKIVSVGMVGQDTATVTRVFLDPFFKVKIMGTVFEDVNYGGGAGRSLSACSGVRRPNVRVELYDAGGNFSSAVLTDSNGLYTFPGIVNGAAGTVRVVSATVLSSRTGATGTLLPVQTFRTNAAGGSAVAVSDHVGGETPSLADAGNGSTTLSALSSSTTTAQSIAPVKAGSGDLSQVDFGFNFDTIVNRNDSGPGSLRQFLLNANDLSNVGLAQAGLTPSVDNAVFMLADGIARPGLNVGYAPQFSAGVASIAPLSALPSVTDPAVLDATRQPGWVSAPIVELNGTGAGAGANGLRITAGGSVLRGLVVNRFSAAGIRLETGGGNTVVGCFVGLSASGAAASANGGSGIEIAGSANNTLGGAGAARNILSGNGGPGIFLQGAAATGTVILNNFIGTDSTGAAAIGNNGNGIALDGAGSSAVGGTAGGAGNLISGNVGRGIYLLNGASGNIIQGNVIGRNAANSAALANSLSGILVADSSSNTFGSTSLSAGANVVMTNGGAGFSFTGTSTGNVVQFNVIASNSGGGVVLTASGASTGNAIQSNSIYANTGLGIDLGGNGVTANNGTKSASLPNNEMDSPVFTVAALSGTTLTVKGYVGSAPGQATFGGAAIQVFKSDNDASGYGEGRTLMGTLTADAGGDFSGVFAVSGLAAGDKLTAAATDDSGNTSEFGANISVGTALGVNPAATFWRATGDAGALGTVAVDLQIYGIVPGQTIRLQQIGAFRNNPANPDNSTQMIAVFSSTSTLLGPDVQARVSGAINAGTDFVSAANAYGYATDIPEDFEVTDFSIIVPPNARYLFVQARDSRYGNDDDPNGDYAIVMTR